MGQVLVRQSVPKKAGGSVEFRYTARVRLKGVVSCKTFRTQTQAESWIEKEEARINREALQGTLIKGQFKVKDAIEVYKEHRLEHLAGKTWESTIKRINQYLGDVQLTELKEADILNARSKYRKSRNPFLSNSSCNKFTTCLRNILKVARKFEMMGHDPFKEFERFDEKGAVRNRYLSDEERERLLESAKLSDNPHLWVIINVALMTGFRRNTVRNLRWANIDFDGRMIRLQNAQVNEERKRGKPRSPNVPIVPALGEIIQNHKRTYGEISPLLFPSPKDPLKPIDFRTAWRVTIKRAKISNFKFHDIRHTTGTYLGRMKVPLHIIQQILGHSDPKMTLRYVTPVEETMRAEMDRVFNFEPPKDISKDGTNG